MKKLGYVLIGCMLLLRAVFSGVNANQQDIPTPAMTPDPWAPQTINLTARDGLSLSASFYPAKGNTSAARALLLLHMAYSDRRAWHSFAQTAQEAGYAVLALDSRGHGESAGEKVFDVTMDWDVDAALTWLMERSDVDSRHVGIAGASLGANLALRAGASHPQVKSVALLSPGMQLWNISIQEAIVKYGRRPVFIAASEEDAYPAGTSRQLESMARGEHRLHIYPGATHGTDMFQTHNDLASMLLEWFNSM